MKSDAFPGVGRHQKSLSGIFFYGNLLFDISDGDDGDDATEMTTITTLTATTATRTTKVGNKN